MNRVIFGCECQMISYPFSKTQPQDSIGWKSKQHLFNNQVLNSKLKSFLTKGKSGRPIHLNNGQSIVLSNRMALLIKGSLHFLPFSIQTPDMTDASIFLFIIKSRFENWNRLYKNKIKILTPIATYLLQKNLLLYLNR